METWSRTGCGSVHIDAGTECSGSVCGSSESSLELNTGEHIAQGMNVHPENFLGFGIIEGDTVQCDIDLRTFHTTHCHFGIAQTCTAFIY